MKLIVGLGNPGREYAGTRHNVGFMAVDRLARHHGLDQAGGGTGAKTKFHAGVLEGRLGGQKVLLVQPLTYVNRSGRAVGQAVHFYKLDPSEVLILVDDVSLPIGRIRLRSEGSPGGHNGLADIERALNSRAYPRLRIGIDPPPGRMAQRDYVLGRFTPDQQDQLDPVLDQTADAVECWIAEGIDQAMTRFNARPPRI